MIGKTGFPNLLEGASGSVQDLQNKAGAPTMNRCPGAEHLSGTPTLTTKICPQCGGEIDLFSIDTHAACEHCGFIAYNDTQHCIRWCKYARQCVGDALYERMMQTHSGEGIKPGGVP
jgi:hypothetical protein